MIWLSTFWLNMILEKDWNPKLKLEAKWIQPGTEKHITSNGFETKETNHAVTKDKHSTCMPFLQSFLEPFVIAIGALSLLKFVFPVDIISLIGTESSASFEKKKKEDDFRDGELRTFKTSPCKCWASAVAPLALSIIKREIKD